MGKNTEANSQTNALLLSQLKQLYGKSGIADSEDEFDAESSHDSIALSALIAEVVSEGPLDVEGESVYNTSNGEDKSEPQPKKKKSGKKYADKTQKTQTIKAEDFVSVLKSGEDISEGARYTSPLSQHRPTQPESVKTAVLKNADKEDDAQRSEQISEDDIVIENNGEDITFGELEKESEEVEDVTFGELDDESGEDEGVTFDDIEETSMSGDISEDEAVSQNQAAIVEDMETSARNAEKNGLSAYYALLEDDEYDDIDEEQTEGETSEVNTVRNAEKAIEAEESNKTDIAEIILSRDGYTDDPLQWHFESYNPVNISEMPEDEVGEPQKKKEEIKDDEISLLLQLGYKNELKSEVGEERTDFVVQSISNSYRPDRNKIPFGFCGKEFSEKDQIPKIKQKYDSDKRMLIVKTALFSAIAVVLLILSLIAKNRTDISSVIMFPIMEMIIMGLGCTVIYKEIASGIIGIFKFSPDIFAIPIFSVLILAFYDVMTVIMAITNSDLLNTNTISLFGFTSSLFFIFALVSQLMNCSREQKTFGLISGAETLYVGEIPTSGEEKASDSDTSSTREARKNSKGNTVIFKKSRYISEYFKRTSESSYRTINVALAMVLSLVFAMLLSIIIVSTGNGNSIDVVSTFIFTFYVCLSASFILSMPVMLFAASKNLNEKKSGIIGTGAVEEYANVNSAIFPDTDAVSVSENIEVIPLGSGDMNEAIKTSHRLFSSLGGTLCEALKNNSYNADTSVSYANINIKSINDDGVDLYMDENTHILFGNKKFIMTCADNYNAELLDSIPQNKTHGKEVAYLFINGMPCLGYVMSLKYKKDFLDVVQLLSANHVNAVVSTYEPHVRSARLDNTNIATYRPNKHESPDKNISRFGGIISSGNSTNAAYPLLMCKDISENSRKASIISWCLIGAGIVISLIVTLIGYLVSGAQGLLKLRDLFSAVMQLGGIVPSVVLSLKLYKKYK